MDIAVEADESSDDTTDTEDTSTGALGFAREQTAKSAVTRGVLDRLPSRRVVFAVGAATGSAVTAAVFLLATRLLF